MDPGLRLGSLFLGGWVNWDLHPDGSVDYIRIPEGDRRPITTAWRYAAMHCNWLHNDKATTLEAFLTGAYTLDSTLNDRLPMVDRNPSARFWIPSEDEWVKATYFDPNRYGPGQPGYWMYAISADTVPISAFPEAGGQTSAGIILTRPPGLYPEVGAYTNIRSPWGLWDVSGGPSEWTDTSYVSDTIHGPIHGYFAKGSGYGDLDIVDVTDHIDHLAGSTAFSSRGGVRIASSVPSSGSLAVMAFATLLVARSRKRRVR